MLRKTYQDLLRSSLQGDAKAFNEVVRRFHSMALALALRRLGNAASADDAVQEAFLTAFCKLSTLNDVDAFPSWLRAIVISCCNRLHRKQPGTIPLDDVAAHTPSDLPEPFEVMTRFQDRRMVLEILDGLSGVMRQACMLRYVQGQTYREIATLLGIPMGTLKRRLHDAREEILKQYNAPRRPCIRIGYLPISDHLLAMVAHHRHDHDHFQMLLKRFLSWSALVRALRNGVVDAALMMAPLVMSLKNAGESILYILDGHHDGSAITAAEEVAHNKSLTGKRFGLPHVMSTHTMILNAMLATQGDKGASSKFIGPSYLIPSLKTRQIDAFFCAEPWSTLSAKQGSGRIMIRSKDIVPGHLCCILVVRTAFARRRASIVGTCARSFLDAASFITADHHAGARIQNLYTGVDPGVAEHVLSQGDISFTDLNPEMSRAAATMSLALRTGLLDKPCALDSLVSSDFV